MLSFLLRKKWIALSSFSGALVLGLVFANSSILFVIVREGLSDTEWTRCPVSPGTVFEVEYVHSMYGVKQKEVFTVEPSGAFHLEKVLFGSLAAAYYYETDASAGLLRQGDLWAIGGKGKRFSVLRYRVSPQTGHTLKIGERTIDLSKGPPGGEGLLLITGARTRVFSSVFERLRSLFSSLGLYVLSGKEGRGDSSQRPK